MADITIHTQDPGAEPEAITAAQAQAHETAAQIAHSVASEVSANVAENTAKDTVEDAVADHIDAKGTEQSADNEVNSDSAMVLSALTGITDRLDKLEKNGTAVVDDASSVVSNDANAASVTAGTLAPNAEPDSDASPVKDEEESEKAVEKAASKSRNKDVEPRRKKGWRQALLGGSGGHK